VKNMRLRSGGLPSSNSQVASFGGQVENTLKLFWYSGLEAGHDHGCGANRGNDNAKDHGVPLRTHQFCFSLFAEPLTGRSQPPPSRALAPVGMARLHRTDSDDKRVGAFRRLSSPFVQTNCDEETLCLWPSFRAGAKNPVQPTEDVWYTRR